MSSVLGVSVGAGAIRLARPLSGNPSGQLAAESFELQAIPVTGQQPGELAAETIGVTLEATPGINATAIAYRGDQHASALRAAMARQQITNYQLVPEIDAALAYAENSGELQGVASLVVYDLGSSGLSVSLVDVPSRQLRHTERTSDISGDYIDSLIREQQIASGRIAHPHDPSGLAELDTLCRVAKEQLSTNTAVALPSEHGLVLLAQENFESLINLAIESSARITREVIARSERPAQAVLAIGGGSRIPLVAEVLRHRLGIPVVVPDSPETVMARGAALLARPVQPARPPAPAGLPPGFDNDQMSPAWLTEHARRQDRREVSGAVLTVSALAVLAALGLGLGYGPQVLEQDSQGSDDYTTTVPTTISPTPTREQQLASIPSTTPESESVAEPPPRRQTTEAPTTTQGPNTFVVPGLPPIVVPTIPPDVFPFPPPPAQPPA
ncbi:Hsp70 family protein [Nocardia donostiensis]|uniref:Molecular chaperone n=1 Tax=Nocardia donostiensis TaxID=1538463 RepID=A0A1W0ATK1_9NOCA|nr:Hsp70 family protein [Nocardia donostiensis]ONM49455.1 molecular chaperone [Nocardia donostiensis]OQS13565.1 molecular chaperone [Nocardia donostiensis]OQS19932.1 molecular chaperone [Nocardia donostiensis]